MQENPFSNYPYLTLFYMTPRELVNQVYLGDFPRNPHVFIHSDKWKESYESDSFLLLLIDGWAYLMWPHFNVKGGVECYSGYDPLWRFSRLYPLWEKILRRFLNVSSEDFAFYPRDAFIPFPTMEEALKRTGIIFDLVRKHSKFDAMREIVLENRCHEDFDGRSSTIKTDFYRQYYHTRALTKVLSIEEEDWGGDEPSRYEVNIENRLWAESFLDGLSERDGKIIKLIHSGYRQAEIAKIVGFANHSAVSKRIKTIAKMLQKFRQEERDGGGHAKPSHVKFDEIEFSYKRNNT